MRTPVPKKALAVMLIAKDSGGRDGTRTSNGMVSAIFGTDATVTVTVEARHGFLGEEGERLFEDCCGGG